jgi:glycine/D-amino acid oxidase-like deaminating enzyme
VTQELHRVSFSLHESLAETLKLETYRKIPTLSVAGGASLPDQRPPVSWLDGDVARAELMDEHTAQVTPAELVRRMHEESQRVPGARTVLHAEATEVLLDANDDRVIGVEIRHHPPSESNATPNAIERIECDVVVVAMGPWSCRATDWFDGLEVPMTGIKSVSLLFDASRAVAEEPAALFCAEDANACHLEVYPRSTGEVYICGCGGSEYVDETRLRPGGDLDSAARVTTDVSRVKAASASFKGLSASVGKNGPKKTQTCMRPCVTDALPVIGPVPGYEGAFINCAHNCWGILWAPASGKALAERILDGAAKTVRLEPFSPRRFFKARDAGNGRGRKMRERDVGEQW